MQSSLGRHSLPNYVLANCCINDGLVVWLC